jgi:hypothetical protein
MGARNGATEHLARMGIAAIPLAEGIRHFMRLTTQVRRPFRS